MIFRYVALFVYNRDTHLKATLASIESCIDSESFHYYIFSDGPKSDFYLHKIRQVRTCIDNFAAKFNCTVVNRSVNIGLSGSIMSGISYCFQS